MFKTFTLASFIAIAAAAANSTVIVENVHTTTATITSCEDQKCVTSEVPQVVTETQVHHVTQWIEHCEDNACHQVPATESKVTKTIEGVETIYTTVCPLTTEVPAPSASVATETVVEGPKTVTVTCVDYHCLEEKPRPTDCAAEDVIVFVCNGEQCVKPAPVTSASVSVVTEHPITKAPVVSTSAPVVDEQQSTTIVTVCPPEGCAAKNTTQPKQPEQVEIYEGGASSLKIGFAVAAVAAAALL